MPVTVRTILDLEEMRHGVPEVLTGTARLDAAVSWVHIAETEEVASLLEGGEVILSSSAMFRSSPERTRAFLTRLEAAGAAAFVIEIVDVAGRPDARARRVVEAAVEGVSLPVIVLTTRTRYVRVTQASHRLLIGEQLARVEFARRIHEVFTELSLEGADEQRIVATTAELAGTAVVLEDASHRVLAFDGGSVSADSLLADWPQAPGETGPQVPVGVRGRRWGWLVAPFADRADADVAQILERAGQAITLARMATQDERDLLQQATAGFLHELMARAEMTEAQALARARTLGMPGATAYVPVAVRLEEQVGALPRDLQLRERALWDEFGAAARHVGVPVLSGGLRTGVFAAVLGLPSADACDEVLTAVLARVSESLGGDGVAREPGDDAADALDVGVGGTAARLREAGAELASAIQVADIVATMQVRSRLYHRFADVRLRGVLAVLRDDPRLRAFAEAELGPLLARGDSLRFLTTFLEHGGNKTAVAAASHLSRPAVYARTRYVEKLLGVSLDDAESRTSLHAALLWLQLTASG